MELKELLEGYIGDHDLVDMKAEIAVELDGVVCSIESVEFSGWPGKRDRMIILTPKEQP